jgi:hypothetical protein
MRALTPRLTLVIPLGLAIACHRTEHTHRVELSLAPTSAESIPDAPLNGTIRGAQFRGEVATYTIDRRAGYEHVDLRVLGSELEDPCERRRAPAVTAVWIRRRDASSLAVGSIRVAPDSKGAWEVHYQTNVDGEWLGSGTASALLALDEVRPDLTLRGGLWACFDDGLGSCVSGSFTAKYCPIRIDSPVRGTGNMERPPPGGSTSAPTVSESASTEAETTADAAPPRARTAPGGEQP